MSDYCWAIVLTKEHLWEFLQEQVFTTSPVELYGEMELLRLLDQFFDRALCYGNGRVRTVRVQEPNNPLRFWRKARLAHEPYFEGFANTKDFTTVFWLGCTPTGIIVSREYSLGSSLRGSAFL